DHIMDQFDGDSDAPVALSQNEQENRANRNRKGCNRHFKDEVLLRGWSVRRCAEIPASGGPATAVSGEPLPNSTWCLDQSTRLPAERDVDTYSTRHEAVWHACEATVARRGAEMASAAAEGKEDGLVFSELVSRACREAGKCEKSQKRKPRKAKMSQKKREKADL
ncbi:unnamed protein product, partial [Polarella glacialis]